jgi:hypothetical protein
MTIPRLPALAWLAPAAFLLLAACPPAQAQSFLDKARKLLESADEMLPGAGGLTEGEIGAGLKEALKVGTERVVSQLGVLDGFNSDPQIHIPLPGALKDVQSMLRKIGYAGLADDLELKLNRAAEAAVPEAKALFWQAIGAMTLEDARGILEGPEDSATRYFKSKMSAPLGERFSPIVDKTLSEVGALKAYDDMMGQYRAIPFVPDVRADLEDYVVDKAMDGLFHYVAVEEAAIRRDPAKRTTELLRKVFGSS